MPTSIAPVVLARVRMVQSGSQADYSQQLILYYEEDQLLEACAKLIEQLYLAGVFTKNG